MAAGRHRSARWFRDARRGLWHLRHGGVAQYRRWFRRRRIDGGASTDGRTQRDGTLTFAPWPVPDLPPTRPGLRVGVILDDFSRTAFRFEWDQVELQPSSWRQTVEQTPIDLLFVESAWAGNGGGWRYHLTGPTAPRPAVVELLTWCKQHGVPTVFWNKEDPIHFEDFLDVARLFDHVFTTDSNRVRAYRESLDHDRVGVLPFAAQRAIHNPVRRGKGHQSRDMAFAGMYFAHRHPERRDQMTMLLGAAIEAGPRMDKGLEIFSRQLGGDERYQFPAPFDVHVVGSLDYGRMLTAYRAYKVFLNVNTVVDSPSMCARRVFEISASGTPVVSTPSDAIEALFPSDEVVQVDDPELAVLHLRALVRNAELRDRMVHRAQRRIWAGHTYGHRVEAVLDAVGLAGHRVMADRPRVTALVSSNRPGQVDHVLRTLGAQRDVDVQLSYLAHGFDVDEADLRARAVDAGLADVVVLRAGTDVPLGQCLNLLVAAADGSYVAKCDDDDLYGPHYLRDQVNALGYSGADVVGKQAHHLYLEGLDVVVLRAAEREHRFTDLVMGPTIVTTADLAHTTPFPAVSRGEDTGFLAAVSGQGGTIYSADRFNFVQVRAADREHTWSASDLELLAGSDIQVFGRLPEHALV